MNDKPIPIPPELSQALYETRVIVLLEDLQKQAFHQVVFTQEQFMKLNDCVMELFCGKDKSDSFIVPIEGRAPISQKVFGEMQTFYDVK